MRIDAYNQVNQIYQATKTAKTKAKPSKNITDTLEVSNVGKDLQIAKQALNATSDVREEKINAIKAAMASGTYNVSAEELADNILNRYFDATI